MILQVTITGRPINRQTGMKSRFYGYDDDQCSVEELALQHYAGESGGRWQGVHSENGIWRTLFALLMWDVLFADIPNVFWHPFQVLFSYLFCAFGDLVGLELGGD